MGDLVLKGATSGQITVTPTAIAGTNTLTLPAVTGTINTSGAVNQVPSGSASAPSVFPTGDTNTGMFFPAADTIAFTEGGTESMRIDSSGVPMFNCTAQIIRANETFRAQLNAGIASFITSTAGNPVIALRNSGTNGYMMAFNNASAEIGTISSSGSNVAYNTSSDYRLKENIQPMSGALDRVTQLKPVTYTWKADGSDGQGFIAHELQAVVPDAVTGAKDAVDADGNPVYQGVDTSFLVATLTAAIQELSAKLDAAEARIAALEGVN